MQCDVSALVTWQIIYNMVVVAVTQGLSVCYTCRYMIISVNRGLTLYGIIPGKRSSYQNAV